MTSYTIEDFIGIFPGVISPEDCDDLIAYYKQAESDGLTLNRQLGDKADSKMLKDNEYIFLHNTAADFRIQNKMFACFVEAFQACYPLYTQKYGVLPTLASQGIYRDVKIQKTSPTQGYHVWHCEHGNRDSGSRVLLALAYLNDVGEGGETEFLYQSKRIPATKGTMILCPSGFTHSHRGNPPLNGVKYVINGWLEFTE